MDLLWLVPAAPLVGFLVLFVLHDYLPKTVAAVVGAGSVGVSALAALLVGIDYYEAGAEPTWQLLWTWMSVAGFDPAIRLYLDGLSLAMTGVITGVGFLIHVYATGYMWNDHEEPEGFARFFAYMNLFVFAMLMLVLGDNLLVLFLGWEGVGLCSYLLIGFYHRDPANGYAARKAFVVTRVGDTFMALGLFLLFRELGTLEIQESLTLANEQWAGGDTTMALIIGLLLLGGAVGKSAQVPLQTWLPDAMAGPTPVSALIHAATMVTAGVYLIARTHDLFLLSSDAQFAVALVGLVTLFIASFTALTQRDIKRILAYSTMSQIGYMFLALGVGAWSAAIFHLMTHAFFKALLFLSAGSVILALHHEQDIFKMGGLWRRLPVPFWSMVIGSAALAALPLTSGFYSKDIILLTSFDYQYGGAWFWGLAALAAFMTSLYTARMIFITFFGEMRTEPHDHSGVHMWLPLVILAALAIGGGWFGLAPVAAVLPDGGVD
ncbi:MAG: NADH-quinone oxidoreductase subunit L, partial [Gammaproteobacteria bacterium]|nr:NADH-quinone oxidoreductase subunit L [Gammaproteobacteria bacterium]